MRPPKTPPKPVLPDPLDDGAGAGVAVVAGGTGAGGGRLYPAVVPELLPSPGFGVDDLAPWYPSSSLLFEIFLPLSSGGSGAAGCLHARSDTRMKVVTVIGRFINDSAFSFAVRFWTARYH